jgi:outer membrane scaffolding protein for murein synthesis (MipA/OmpV family)
MELRMTPSRRLLLLLAAVWALPAAAQQPAPSRLELGRVAGTGSTSAYPGAGENTQGARLLPYLVYRGDRLRVERGGVTVRALRTSSFEFDLGTSGALGSSASEVKARQGMPDLGNLIELGPRLTWHIGEQPGGARWRLGLSASHWLTPDWRVFALARIDHIAGAANRASPLVERRAGASVGIGVQWVFIRSAEAAED